MKVLLAALAASSLLVVAGCGGDDESSSEESSAPTVEDVQACLEDEGLDVELRSGSIDQLLVNGGETEGGSTVAFYASEEDATQNADAAKDVTGGDVQQNGSVVVITQGGSERERVQGCAA